MVNDSKSNNKKLEWLRSVADYLPVPAHHLAQFSDELINKTLRENNLPPLYSDVSEIPSDPMSRAVWAHNYYNALDNGDIPYSSEYGNNINRVPNEGSAGDTPSRDPDDNVLRVDPDEDEPQSPRPDYEYEGSTPNFDRNDDGKVDDPSAYEDWKESQAAEHGTWFERIFGTSFQTLVQSLVGKYTDAAVTGGEIQRNQWDLDKMNIANEFSAQQAEISRDWQERMYDQYNSLSGKIHQAEQAGVNPMFAVTGNAVSPMSTSTGSPSGSVASGSGQKSTSDILSSIASLIGLKSQIKKTNAETEAIQTQTDISLQKLSYELNNMQSSTDLNIQKVVESATSIEKMKADIGLTTRQAEVATEQMHYLIAQTNYINAIREPETRLKRAQAVISEWQEKNKELFKGLDIGLDAVNTIVDLGIGIFNAKTGRIFANN